MDIWSIYTHISYVWYRLKSVDSTIKHKIKVCKENLSQKKRVDQPQMAWLMNLWRSLYVCIYRVMVGKKNQEIKGIGVSLRWRHNDHDGVSNHQPRGCLLNRLFRRKSKKTSKLRVTGLCAGDRWISRTNGQWRGKCFHLMTSSW